MSDIAYSVVIPAANQMDHIEQIVVRFAEELATLPESFEIIVVVNNSHDDTETICRRLAERDGRVRVMTSPAGWGNAVRAGLGAARGEVVCYTNSARTQPADLVLAIRYAAVNDATVVKASRKTRESLVRRIGSIVYNFEGRMLFGLAVWDINGTPKAFHRSLTERLRLTQPGDLLDLELIVNCRRRNIPIVEMPVYITDRHGGASTTNLLSALRMYTVPLRWPRSRS